MMRLDIVYVFVLLQLWIQPCFSESDDQPLECIDYYNDKRGHLYKGTVSVTKTGKPCQKWTGMFPNFIMYSWSLNTKDQVTENYCRNPFNTKEKPTLLPVEGDEVAERPFCYFAAEKGSEYCDIPYCDYTGGPIAVKSIGSREPTSYMMTPELPNDLRERKSPSPLSTMASKWFRLRTLDEENATDVTVTYRPTFTPTLPEATTAVEGLVWWNTRATMGSFSRIFLMAYHMINLIMTAATNLILIYIIATRINLVRKPCVIPLLVASIFALINVTANYGFYRGLEMGENWIWVYQRGLCEFSNASLEKVTILHVLLYSIVTMEATLAMRYPSTYNRASILTAATIILLTFISIIYVSATTFHYFFWIELPDLLPGWISLFGITEGVKQYEIYVKGNGGYTDVKGPLTSEYERFWKRCSRYNIPDTWDSHVYIWSSIVPCLIGLGCMITSLIVTYLPGHRKRNFIDALSGKHNFTTADLEELVKAAKSISIVTMICTIIPAVENLHTFIPTISPSFLEAAEEIFGMVNYYWWVELLRRLFAMTSWLPALTSLFLNPVLAKARKGEQRDYNLTFLC
ncbi:hypothetical protein ACHWQZ_G018423 [Mnemiopsis leidyi]